MQQLKGGLKFADMFMFNSRFKIKHTLQAAYIKTIVKKYILHNNFI
jgi:hypothetical protein